MKRTTVLLFLVLAATWAIANDGVYWGSGGLIYPMKETRISLQKEVLSFKLSGNVAQVDVFFEFQNPDSERTVLVGFQVPSPSGDVPDEICSTPPISDFRIMVDGRLLPYQVKMAECEDCPLVDLGGLTFNQSMSGIFVYLFEMKFKPGSNRVQHAYGFRAGGTVDMDRSFNYILTTGAKWAGSSIGSFTLEIDPGANERLFVEDVFGDGAEWFVAGVGRVGQPKHGVWGEMERTVRVLTGKLIVSTLNFIPTDNIGFHAQRPLMFLDWPQDDSPYSEQVLYALRGRTLDLGTEHLLTKADLRFLRNAVYAQHGFAFKDPEVRKIFERFDWYIPDPNLEWNDAILSREDKFFIEQIKLKEAER